MTDDAPLLKTCPTCSAEVDVSSCPPFSNMACPACGEMMRVREVFRHYEIEAEIGRGGMSRVFRARDPSLDRHVALKVLLDRYTLDDERVHQFEKEAQITASFTHPNVVKVYAVGREGRDLVIVMELVENGSLDELIAAQGRVPESQALTWALQTAQGLQAAYQNGLIHRDVKPGNILLSTDRSAKLVDFGLALMFRREVDESNEIWATPYYVPPEKLMGQGEDHRSDIYSLGATLYHLLVGKPSFEVVTGTYEELREAKIKPVQLKPVVPHVSHAACALVERMMAPQPGNRHASYEELIAGIRKAKAASIDPLARRSTHSIQRLGGAGQRFLAKQRALQGAKHRRQAAIAATALLALLLFGIWLIHLGGVANPEQDKGALAIAGARAPEDKGPSTLENEARSALKQARQALLERDWGLAQRRCQIVLGTADAPLSVKQWALFHTGLAQLLGSDEPASRDSFARAGEHKGEQPNLDELFQEAGRHLRRDANIPGEVAEKTSGGFCRPVVLLAYGLKNWERGAWDDARVHLERFLALTPSEEFAWIADYHVLVQEHVADLQWLTALKPTGTYTDDQALRAEEHRLRAFAERAKTERAGALVQHRLATIADSLEARGQHVAQAAEAEAEQAALEVERWQTLQAKLEPLAASFSFTAGVELIRAHQPLFATTEGRTGIDDQLYLWQKAGDFIEHLLPATAGLQSRLTRPEGTKLSGKITAANGESLTIRTATGEVTVPLQQLTPNDLAHLAGKLIEGTRDSNLFYRRLEELVFFAYLTGLEEVLQESIAALRRENRPFRERWARLQAFYNSLAQESRHG